MRSRFFVLIINIFVIILFMQFNETVSATVQNRVQKDKINEFKSYQNVVNNTVAMVSNNNARVLARKHGLQIMNVTWEDTGRYKNSCVGPNISDMTIQVQVSNPKNQSHRLFCMPVIRFPNFSDKTCDVKTDKFYLLTGNEKGKNLGKVNLKRFLKNIRRYLSQPKSWKGNRKSLLAKRDTHVLVSAQACFLPIPKNGKATFNPVLFNYQSYAKNPAVLTILVTREGTSVTIIDNQRDGFNAGRTWGQRLFFNQKGNRASLTGIRMSDFKKNNNRKNIGKVTVKGSDRGLNMVLLIQVPLKHKAIRRYSAATGGGGIYPSSSIQMECVKRQSNVENAVIGHGKIEGPFTEIDNLPIERDTRFPVRVTVQFYKATSNGVVSNSDMASIAKQIGKVYKNADYVGSLVVEGKKGRPTEHNGPQVEPAGWWNNFWNQYEREHKQSRSQALRMIYRITGKKWNPRNRREIIRKLNEAKRKS